MPADFAILRFVRYEGGRDVLGEHEWRGSWPPPEEMSRLVGRLSGGQAIAVGHDAFEAAKRLYTEGKTDDMPNWDDIMEIQKYRRLMHSQLDDSAASHPHIVRGAVYVLVSKEVTDGGVLSIGTA